MRTYLVEDNSTIRDNLISTLEELAPVQTVGTSATEEEGTKWLTLNQGLWDLAILDLFLKSGSGLGVLEACRSRGVRKNIVVFSNYATHEVRLICAHLGVDAVFDKSTEIEALIAYCSAQWKQLETSAESKLNLEGV